MCFECICLFMLLLSISVLFLFLLVSGLTAACDCGTPWTSVVTFMPCDYPRFLRVLTLTGPVNCSELLASEAFGCN